MTVTRIFQGRPITGRTVLFGMIAFFGVIAAVNGVFVYFALDSWPGLTTEKAYERGRDYNATLAAAEAQAALGWKSAVEIKDGKIQVRLTDRQGHPLDGVVVSAILRRPVRPDIDQSIALTADGAGGYAAQVTLPAAGAWDAEINVGPPAAPRYRMIHRLQVTP